MKKKERKLRRWLRALRKKDKMEYGKAIGSVIGATIVMDSYGRLFKKGKKIATKKTYKKKKKK